jgi:hypothetical protein
MTETEDKWIERIRQWKESGRRLEDFCAGQPYKASTMRWWATELRRRGAARDTLNAANAGTIKLAQVIRRADTARAERALLVEVSGARIAVERGFDAELLAEVVRALGGQR